jgi:hypothetical protein
MNERIARDGGGGNDPRRDQTTNRLAKRVEQSAGKPPATPTASRRRSPLKLFLLVFALSIPFWLIAA